MIANLPFVIVPDDRVENVAAFATKFCALTVEIVAT